MSDKLYIIIPAYNEKDNIRQVVTEWYSIAENYGEDSRLVVIDDGSRDVTYSILEELSHSMPKLIPLTKPNGGHGSTILYGYNYALENGADYIFQTDSDGQTLPSEFAPFWNSRDKYDMCIGYRSHRRDGLSRVIVTRVLRLVVYLTFHVFVLDANTPYRLMSADSLKECIKYVPENFFLSNVALTAIFKKRGKKMHFIPITFRPRQGGTNSINIKKIFKVGMQSLSDFNKINSDVDASLKDIAN